MIIEQWKLVPDYSDYEVSDLGRVRSWKNGRQGRRSEPRLLKGSRNSCGYLLVNLPKGSGWRTQYVHRLVLAAFVGPCPQDYEACHNNGVRDDNRLENLRWDTARNNSRDKIKHGTNNRGERNGSARLTWTKVREIRKLLKEGLSSVQLAKLFEVSRSNIDRIKLNNTWKEGEPT